MKTKQEIREFIRQQRREYDRVAEDSALICGKIAAMPEFIGAGTVLSYSPMRGEVDVRPLAAFGKKIVLPEDEPFPDPSSIDFAVVPGVAYDRAANRLGRGGGYYDRLISQLRCITVAPAFSFQIFDEVPMEPWDRPVDRVVTEK